MGDNASVGKVNLDLGINYSGFKKELNGISGNIAPMLTKSFAKIGMAAAAAFSTAALVSFSKSAIGLASDLQEVQNVVDVTFGSMSNDINEFAQDAITSFGMSELSTKKFASSFGASLKSIGFAPKQFTDMSKELTKLTGDMSSFYNLKHEDAWNKIRAGVISGESEPLKVLGVNLSVASLEAFALSKGITKSYDSMSELEKVTLRYNAVMAATSDAQGDFARTSGSWANQTRVLNEQFNSMKAIVGAGLINAFTPLLSVINSIIAKLTVAASYFRAFTGAIFGEQKSSSAAVVEGVATSLDNVTSAANGAGKAAKKAQGSLAGFDEMNVVGQQSGAGGDAGGMAAQEVPPLIDEEKLLGESTISGIENEMRNLVDNIKSGFVDVSNYISTNFGPTIESAKAIASGLYETISKVFGDIKMVVSPILDWFATYGPSSFSAFVNSSAEIIKGIFDVVSLVFNTLWDNAVAPGLNIVSTMITDVLTIMKDAWVEHGTNIVEGIKTYLGWISTLFSTFWDSFLGPIVETLLNTLSWLWDEHFKGLVESVVELFFAVQEAFLDILNVLLMPFINWLIKTFGPTFSRIFKLAIEIVGTLAAVVTDVVNGAIKILTGLINFLTGVFTLNWGKAWKGIVQIFEGIFTGLGGIVKGVFNIIIDLVNFLIDKMNDISFDVPDWIPGIGGKSFGISIPKIPKLAKGGLVSSPTLAMVGDNKGASVDPEVVSPLSKLQDMIGSNNQPLIEVLLAILQAIEDLDLVFEIDGEKMGRAMKKEIDKETARLGKKVVVIGG